MHLLGRFTSKAVKRSFWNNQFYESICECAFFTRCLLSQNINHYRIEMEQTSRLRGENLACNEAVF